MPAPPNFDELKAAIEHDIEMMNKAIQDERTDYRWYLKDADANGFHVQRSPANTQHQSARKNVLTVGHGVGAVAVITEQSSQPVALHWNRETLECLLQMGPWPPCSPDRLSQIILEPLFTPRRA